MSDRIPDFQTLMHPLLTLLKDEAPHNLREVMDKLAAQFELTEEDLKIKVPSGQMPLFKNRVGWATSYLKNSGLIYYPPARGIPDNGNREGCYCSKHQLYKYCLFKAI